MAEGDLGAPKASGQRDAYSDRTKAEEDKYVRQQELQKLKALREKLTSQRTSIGDLINNIDEMTKEQNEGESKDKK
ncbi:MAG: hypothetical protein M1831_001806 [Alyxoria varia]|nr:MAG: hypothetical protein M1831_001806 [Alyxoria varia]